MRAYLLFITLAFLCNQHAAACDNLVAILKNAYPQAQFLSQSGEKAGDKEKIVEFVVSTSAPVHVDVDRDVRCKVWPAHPQMTLIGVTITRVDPADDVSDADFDMIVADTQTARVRNRLLEPGMMNGDAYRKAPKGFDTANYAVSQEALVFGFRTRSIAGGLGHSSVLENLTLYALGGGRLLRVMDDFLVSTENQGSAEFSDEHRRTSCGEREERKVSLVVGTTAHHGFKDIDVLAIQEKLRCTLTSKDEDQWIPGKSRKERQKLVYDGLRYVLQEH